MERLSSKEMKIAARLVWMADGASCQSATVGVLVSRVGVRNLTLPERWSLSTSPWDLWTPWRGVRGPKSAPVEGEHELFGFLTTEPNAIVGPIHPKAMPVILTTPAGVDRWLGAETPDALELQRPLPDQALRIVARGEKVDTMTSIPFEAEGVRGHLHRADDAGDGMVLTHGAGGNGDAPLLRAVAEAFQSAGVTLLRCDLPFRQQRPVGPPRPADSAKDRAGLRAAATAVRSIVNRRVILAGQSYGGRQAAMLAADEPELVEGSCSSPTPPSSR